MFSGTRTRPSALARDEKMLAPRGRGKAKYWSSLPMMFTRIISSMPIRDGILYGVMHEISSFVMEVDINFSTSGSKKILKLVVAETG